MRKILVTGGSGFIGKVLINKLVNEGCFIRATFSGSKDIFQKKTHANLEWVKHDLITDDLNHDTLLSGMDIVIHLAGHAHISHVDDRTIQSAREININGTSRLASLAVKSGVRKFVFISTVKVHGEKTGANHDGTMQRFSEDHVPRPQDAYAASKLEAEQEIKMIFRNTPVNYTIIRPPLVYGPGVKANFLKLIDIVSKGFPLPFASVRNLRSMINVNNLCQAISCIIEKAEISANQTYLVSDIDISTPDLINTISEQFNLKAKLFPCPLPLLKIAASLTGYRSVIDRLTESLLVDCSKIRHEVGWTPEMDFRNSLIDTVAWYKSSQNK